MKYFSTSIVQNDCIYT